MFIPLPANPNRLTTGVRTPSIQNVVMVIQSEVVLEVVMVDPSDRVMLDPGKVLFDNTDMVMFRLSIRLCSLIITQCGGKIMYRVVATFSLCC